MPLSKIPNHCLFVPVWLWLGSLNWILQLLLTVVSYYTHSYDDILVNGLPDWRQPVFYYRRVRKMSNGELGFLLFLILTVGHYAVIWSIYLEKQLVSAELLYAIAQLLSCNASFCISPSQIFRLTAEGLDSIETFTDQHVEQPTTVLFSIMFSGMKM